MRLNTYVADNVLKCPYQSDDTTVCDVSFVIILELNMLEHCVETKMYEEIGQNRFIPYTRHVGIPAEWRYSSAHS